MLMTIITAMMVSYTALLDRFPCHLCLPAHLRLVAHQRIDCAHGDQDRGQYNVAQPAPFVDVGMAPNTGS